MLRRKRMLIVITCHDVTFSQIKTAHVSSKATLHSDNDTFFSHSSSIVFCFLNCRLLADAVAKSKKSPEVIQLLNMHTQFDNASGDKVRMLFV